MSRILSNLNLKLATSKHQCLIVPFRTKYYHNRHRDPKYRLERHRKVWKVKLPDFDSRYNKNERLDVDEIRAKMKEKGIVPPVVGNERDIYNACTMGILEAYEPPEGDGKSTKLGIKAGINKGKDMISTRRAVSVIRNYDGEDFDLSEFTPKSTEIYIKAHEALANKDEDAVFEYVTEHCFPLMISGMNFHTVHWKYLGDVEPPRVVQVRANDLVTKGNKFAQITVRMYTRQILAVYDRHGRLILGSPTQVKEVLEYIVFEKYLANEYGSWRIHERIRPQMSDNQPVITKTYKSMQN